MRRVLACLVMVLGGCSTERHLHRDFATGQRTSFYLDAVRVAQVPMHSASDPQQEKLPEDSLERVRQQWRELVAQPARSIRLLDLTSDRSVAAADKARTDLDGLMSSPRAGDILPAVHARNPAIRKAFVGWRATLSRFGQAAAYDDVLRRYNSWTTRMSVPVGPPGPSRGREPIGTAIPFPGMRGQLGNLVDRDAKLARIAYVATVNKALTDTRHRLHELAFLDKAIAITAEHTKAVESQAGVARARYRAGSGPYVDVLKAATELSELEERLVTFKRARDSAAAALNTLLDRPTTAEIGQVAEPSLPVKKALIPEGELLEGKVVDGNLSLASVREKLERMRDMLKLAGNRDYFKSLQRHYAFDGRVVPRAGAGRKPAGKDEKPRRMPRMDADSGLITTHLQELRQRIVATEAGLMEREQGVRRQTAMLYFKLDDAFRRERLLAESIVPKAEQTLKASETAYQAGKLRFITMVDALRRLLKARLGRLAAARQLLDHVADLEALANRGLAR